MFYFLIFTVLAYLAGSINISILVAKLSGFGNLRKKGSGNPGASNVYRVMGKWWALVVLLLDVGRGFLVAFLAARLLDAPWQMVVACLAVVAGNLYPIFHKFRGGKGVATALGTYLAISPLATLVFVLTWLAMLAWLGRASVGSFSAMVAYPLVLYIIKADFWMITYATIMLLVILYTHRANVVRILKGQEPKISKKQ
jgi:glycerol-3-phosphate acyltransferase PlsY